ncbi:conserved exported hypothetical protein [Candidatus Accumulibacter aalborgensis]|uniref:Ppx/GppA phosphatase N-terminal domain-containing protein n=1 Tax=Candidatus Accumulibacter aalborgensis TaxID=1860102 RepID=A0A1A8XFE6_9PROT|nr:hypothetical protein [Candidatus Accumulibacter aalborgensis]SBT03092.1 conserved exported hypothetical protein [Candidatus Accumulibacter aalborgensis]
MKRMLPVGRSVVCLVFLACLLSSALAGERCRIAFDMGSSGIRAGASNSAVTRSTEIDYLAALWSGRGLEATLPATVSALAELPATAGFAGDCERVGGGFSAWRLAGQQDKERLLTILAQIREATGVAVLVIPQTVEGAYGYFGARQLLGKGLTTSHVLDIGGGSLQISGADTSLGEMLGQKVWYRHLCRAIRGSESAPCHLQPMSDEEVAIARRLADEKLARVSHALPAPVTMTAVSRPVSRGVFPALTRLAAGGSISASAIDRDGFQFRALSKAIQRIAPLSSETSTALVDASPVFGVYLLSDMLLVEGLLRATGGEYLRVAELDLTNLPGLLADDRAFRWGRHYGCYLERLRHLNLDAYHSDAGSCP